MPRLGRRVVLLVPFFSSKMRNPESDNLCSEDTAFMQIQYLKPSEWGRSSEWLDTFRMKGCFSLENMPKCMPRELKCELKDGLSVEALFDNIDRKRPVQVRVQPEGQDEMHTELVVGYDLDRGVVVLHDQAFPKGGKFVEVPTDKFVRQWDKTKRLAITCSVD